MNWSPIVEPSSATASRAWAAVHSISQALVEQDSGPATPSQTKATQPSYERAVLYGYLAIAYNDPAWAERATSCLNEAVDQAPTTRGHLALHGGLCGLGWALEHFSQLIRRIAALHGDLCDAECQETDEEDVNEELDIAILNRISKEYPRCGNSLVNGLIGFGVYFIERWPRASAMEGIRRVFNLLEDLAEDTKEGITWSSALPLSAPVSGQNGLSNGIDIGVAHGQSSIPHFLTQVSATKLIDRDRCHRLMEGSVSWVIQQHSRRPIFFEMPSGTSPDHARLHQRLAWCCGELGLVVVLMHIASRAERPDWLGIAHSMLEYCLLEARSVPVDSAVDIGLCHGALGIAHMFNRLYRYEGDNRCLEIAAIWYERALAMTASLLGDNRLSARGRTGWFPLHFDSGLLQGAVGIALAFLAAITPIEPEWDRIVLLSTVV